MAAAKKQRVKKRLEESMEGKRAAPKSGAKKKQLQVTVQKLNSGVENLSTAIKPSRRRVRGTRRIADPLALLALPRLGQSEAHERRKEDERMRTRYRDGFLSFDYPFSDIDSDIECAACGEPLAGRQVTVCGEISEDDAFCSRACFADAHPRAFARHLAAIEDDDDAS